jgi:hypothetical protein
LRKNVSAAAQRVKGVTEAVTERPDFPHGNMSIHEEDGPIEFSIEDELIAGAYRQELVE